MKVEREASNVRSSCASYSESVVESRHRDLAHIPGSVSRALAD
jgi:hypothetical protein